MEEFYSVRVWNYRQRPYRCFSFGSDSQEQAIAALREYKGQGWRYEMWHVAESGEETRLVDNDPVDSL